MNEAYIRRHVRHPGHLLAVVGVAYASLFTFEAPVRSVILAVLLVALPLTFLLLSAAFLWVPAMRDYLTDSAHSRNP